MDEATETRAADFWTRMRRRKVVQWGVAYVAGAWGLLQGLSYLSVTFDWPRQLQQLTTVVLMIGLPIVLVLAWYHGDRGEQRVKGTEFAIITLLFLLGGGLFWRYHQAVETTVPTGTATTTSTARQSPTATTDQRPSIAVLPFENRSAKQDDAFFVDGIHDDILTQLSKISGLRVISRTSVERFRNTDLGVPQIAQQLGVSNILEGGVQRAGDRVRINVQLVDANTDAHLWAETYDRELLAANIFSIQTELAAAIAEVLKTTLTPAEKAYGQVVPTQDLQAWEAYQLGRQRMAKRTSAALAEAERFFRKAVALDPSFALAWVGIADTVALQIEYSGRPRGASLDEADRVLDKALKIDSHLPEAWASAGFIALNRSKFERSAQLLRNAIALNPNYAEAYNWLSFALSNLGDRAEALAAAEKAVALDPLSALVNDTLGMTRDFVGRFDEALTTFRHVIEIDPTMATSYVGTGRIQAYGLGNLDQAIPWFEEAIRLDPGNPNYLSALAQLNWEIGNDAAARRLVKQAFTVGGTTAYASAMTAILDFDQGEFESAHTRAADAVEIEPSTVFLLNDLDLRRDEYVTVRARYAKLYPELLQRELPRFTDTHANVAIELALALQRTGEVDQAAALMDGLEAYMQSVPRLGWTGWGFLDARIAVLRGDKVKALALLRKAEKAGCRVIWRYYRDIDPVLEPIRNDPQFKAVFADIEREMAKQRAALAARPKDAPLDLAATST